MEARWKQFQYALAGRLQALEAYFRGELAELHPLQMYVGWFRYYRSATARSGLWRAARPDFVMLPYSIIILISVGGIIADIASRFASG